MRLTEFGDRLSQGESNTYTESRLPAERLIMNSALRLEKDEEKRTAPVQRQISKRTVAPKI